MSSKSNTPQVARPEPQRTLSKELDLDSNGAAANGASDKPKPSIIQTLEAQAEEMY